MLNSIFTYLKLAVLGAAILFGYLYFNALQETKRLDANLNRVRRMHTTVSGLYVNQTDVLVATELELNGARKKNDADRSDYERLLIKAEDRAKKAELEVKELKYVIMTEIEAIDSSKAQVDTAYLDSLKNLNIKLKTLEFGGFKISIDTIVINASNPSKIKVNQPAVTATYSTEIDIFINMYKEKNGKRIKYLKKMRFWLPWKDESTIVSTDPNATIKENISIQWE
jgi:hypothetical protein